MLQLILRMQLCENALLLALLQRDGKKEAELRLEYHALVDSKLDLEHEIMLATLAKNSKLL